ncbi:hypothetical protein [Bacillus sp. T3]|uniref:hypothetical protein n=1 Tax=Bacillus sp. T3 TaxID=467262 RepID=UPI002981D80E|nr:hypothetical protein [Bacillus sp. T3]
MIKQFKNKSYQWSVLGFTVVIVLIMFSFINTDVLSLNGKDFTVEAATKGEQSNETQKTGISKNKPVNNANKPIIVKENSEVRKVISVQETVKERLHTIQQNAPFKILVPQTNKLSLTSAFMNPVSENTKERNVDLLYNTSSGEVHIWESNLNVKTSEKNPLHAPGYNEKIVQIGTQDWNFTPHNDDKDLLIFTSIINDVVIQVSGKIPYAELIEIISSLK